MRCFTVTGNELPDLSAHQQLAVLDVSYNALRSIAPIVANEGLGTMAGQQIDIHHNLLELSACDELSQLLERAALSGAEVRYAAQGNFGSMHASLPDWSSGGVKLLDWVRAVSEDRFLPELACGL